MPDFEPIAKLLEFINEHPSMKSTVQVISLLCLIIGFIRYAMRPAISFHWKLLRTIEQVNVAFPTLMNIASEFKINGGSSLRDCIKRIEDRQVLSDQRTMSLLKSSDACYFEADAVGNYRWVNRRWCELTGMHPDNALGLGWLSTIVPEDQLKVSEQWRMCVTQHREFSMEYRIVTACEDMNLLTIKAVAHVIWADANKEKINGFIGKISEVAVKK